MSTTAWIIVIVVVAVVLLIALAWAGRRRNIEQRRVEADAHREDAKERSLRAERASLAAEEQRAQARRQELDADELSAVAEREKVAAQERRTSARGRSIRTSPIGTSSASPRTHGGRTAPPAPRSGGLASGLAPLSCDGQSGAARAAGTDEGTEDVARVDETDAGLDEAERDDRDDEADVQHEEVGRCDLTAPVSRGLRREELPVRPRRSPLGKTRDDRRRDQCDQSLEGKARARAGRGPRPGRRSRPGARPPERTGARSGAAADRHHKERGHRGPAPPPAQ